MNLSRIINYYYLGKQKFTEATLRLFSFFYVKIYLTIIILLNILNWIVAVTINRQVSQNEIVLHYNVDFGVNLIGSAGNLYLIPALGFFVLLINLAVVNNLNKSEKLLMHFLLAAALAVNLLLLISQAGLYMINLR